jgi:hypothetical protein
MIWSRVLVGLGHGTGHGGTGHSNIRTPLHRRHQPFHGRVNNLKGFSNNLCSFLRAYIQDPRRVVDGSTTFTVIWTSYSIAHRATVPCTTRPSHYNPENAAQDSDADVLGAEILNSIFLVN